LPQLQTKPKYERHSVVLQSNYAFFGHLRDSDVCQFKTDNKFSKTEIERMKYNGAKESKLHYTLKNQIAFALSENCKNDKGINNVQVEKVQKDKAVVSSWKKPDISAKYLTNKLAIELQLSTTFLSVIVDRQEFYKNNQIHILWVFNNFEEDLDKQKFTQSDIFYSNNKNGFEFNEEARGKSIQANDLILCCYYLEPVIQGNAIEEVLKKDYVSLSQLKFDPETYKVYYYDSLSQRNRLKNRLLLQQSIAIRIVKSGNLYELFQYFRTYQLSRLESKYIKKMYHEDVKSLYKVTPVQDVLRG